MRLHWAIHQKDLSRSSPGAEVFFFRDNTTPQEAAAALRRAPLCPFCGTQFPAARIQLVPSELPPSGDRAASLLVDRVPSSLALRLTQQTVRDLAKRSSHRITRTPCGQNQATEQSSRFIHRVIHRIIHRILNEDGDFPRAPSIVRSFARSWRALMRGPRRDGSRRRFSPKRGWILELARSDASFNRA